MTSNPAILSRRSFSKILQAGAAMALAGVPLYGGNNTEILHPELFEPLIGSHFLIGGTRSLKLLGVETKVRAQRAGARKIIPQVTSATLRFESAGPTLPDGSYTLKHPELGSVHLYLSPGRPGRCVSILAHVPPAYLNSIEVPRAQHRQHSPIASSV